MREHKGVEMPQERVIFADHLKVNGVGVRKQDKPVPAGDAAQQFFLHQRLRQKDRTPYLAEFLVSAMEIQDNGELLYEITGIDLAGFQTFHQTGGPNDSGNIRGWSTGEGFYARIASPEVEGNDNAAQVEDDCLDQSLTLADGL